MSRKEPNPSPPAGAVKPPPPPGPPVPGVQDLTALDPCNAPLRIHGVDGPATIARCTKTRGNHGEDHGGPIDRATWPVAKEAAK